ncbi:unnamed protein product, partial [Adineta steineri]
MYWNEDDRKRYLEGAFYKYFKSRDGNTCVLRFHAGGHYAHHFHHVFDFYG